MYLNSDNTYPSYKQVFKLIAKVPTSKSKNYPNLDLAGRRQGLINVVYENLWFCFIKFWWVGRWVGGATQTAGSLNLNPAAGWTPLGLQPLDKVVCANKLFFKGFEVLFFEKHTRLLSTKVKIVPHDIGEI